MSTDQINLSDALRWVYNELSHIRRLHFTLIVLSSIIIIVTLTARTNTLYVEIKKFYEVAGNFYEDRGLRQLFREEINDYPLKELPSELMFIQKFIPKEKLFQFFPIAVSNVESCILSQIRKDFEQGVKVLVVQQIEINQANLQGYLAWKSSMEQKRYEIWPQDAYIQKLPTEDRVGKIKYRVEAGFFYRYQEPIRKKVDGPPSMTSWVRLDEYSGTATFRYTSVSPWKKSDLWFSQNFPYLYAHWKDYEKKTLGNALKEAKKELTEQFVVISLPFGVKIEKNYSLMILPSLLFISFMMLMVEVQHVAAYTRACRNQWASHPLFLSPWIGGRNWWFKWPLLILTLFIFPILSTWLLFRKFPIFGYWESTLLAILMIIFYTIFGYFIARSIRNIDQFSFK